ncbi:hypothetical protein [Vibrio sp. TBV020]|uniref:hypothetical protein n=1 Tax=Vibrio sp. TBV020 TaxID=3137398 RepID=UPI0038CDC37B
MTNLKIKALPLVLTALTSVSLTAQAKSENVVAKSIPLPTLSVFNGHRLELSLEGVQCGKNEYFTDSPNVSILANGTPLEFKRTCHDEVLTFQPINRSENDLFVEILLTNRNLNLRYMASARSYAYNDWQLGPVKAAIKE